MTSTRSVAGRVILGCLIAFMGCPAFADELATITGRITDPRDLVVAGVKIDATNINTNITYSGETNADGLYRIWSIPPGAYRVIVKKTGFAQIVKPGVDLHVQDIITLNFTMQLGSVSETITVEGGAPLINTQDAAVSTVIDRTFVESLPLNGRSFNTLLQLTPGVVIAPTSGLGGGQFSIAGQRTNSNNFLVDGVSANFASPTGLGGEAGLGGTQAFSALGGTSSLVSADDLQEFRIETSSFSAEFGRQPGGQVLLTTRSGTNSLHGGVFEYFRNDIFDANDWFNNAATPPRQKAPEKHNDFGGFLGGPIWKDRTFFYFSYEGARLRLPQTSVQFVPSQSARASAPAALAPYLNAYSLPNGPISASNPNLAQLTGSWSNAATLNTASLRLDHVINNRWSAFARYNYAPSTLVLRGNGFSPSTVTSLPANVQTFTAGVNTLLGSGISNAIRGNYSTQGTASVNSLDSFGGAVVPPAGALFDTLSPSEGRANFNIVGTSGFSIGPGLKNRTKQFAINDDLAFAVAKHELKFGGDYRAIWLDARPLQVSLAYSATSIQTLLATGQAVLSVGAFNRAHVLSQAFSAFGQDTWKLTRRLTFNYGARWELSPAPGTLDSTLFAAWENVDNPAAIAVAPRGTPLWSTGYGNIAPRVGVAYALTQEGDFVLRAGWGLFYDLGSGSAGQLTTAWPNRRTQSAGNVSLPVSNVTTFVPALPTLTPPYTGAFAGNLVGFSPDLKLPKSYQWNIALEKAFRGHQVISATYVGQLGRDLLRDDTLVPPASNANFAPNSSFQLTDNSATSDYDALQLQYRRPLSRRLQALLNYTWSHTLDNASDDFSAFVSGSLVAFSNRTDRGSSGFDVRHSFSGAFTYSIPSLGKYRPLAYVTQGWSLEGIIVARSGFPFTVLTPLNSVQGTIVQGRPNIVPGQPLWVAKASAPGGQIVNVNAFASAAQGQQGSEGRNIIPGFGLTQVDLSVGRKFALGERLNCVFRTDAFNAFNHPNFANPTGNLFPGLTTFLQSQQMLNRGLGALALNPLFQQGGPRSLQFSLRLTF